MPNETIGRMGTSVLPDPPVGNVENIKKRMSISKPLWIGLAGVLLCLLSFIGVSIYVHWDSPRLLHFLADWIPFAITVFLAFFPSAKEMKHWSIRWGWRVGIISIGLLWSLVLLHREDLQEAKEIENSKQTSKQIGEAVTKAITESNTHSDQKFTDIDGRVDNLGKTINQGVGKTESDILSSLKGVGKPDPPEKPKLIFSLWNDTANYSEIPIESENLSPDSDGNYHVKFLIKNDSSVLAQGIELWIAICDACKFIGEQKGFDHFAGMSDRERHRSIPAMNNGTTLLEGNEVIVHPTLPEGEKFAVGIKGTCNTCGPIGQSALYWITPVTGTKPQ